MEEINKPGIGGEVFTLEFSEKYYTPLLEEFHVGFECEYHTSKGGEWCKENMETGTDVWDACIEYEGEEYVRTWEYRVKYLDKEDIESFGFIAESSEESNPKLYIKDNHNLIYYNNNHILIDNGKHRIFEGIIKNKSELKVLLKQLGIDD